MLNKEEVLSRTNKGLDIFRLYVPGQWRIGRNFHNPLYEDRRASCNIYFDKRNNCYRLKDFGNDEYSGDCFAVVGKIKNLDCRNPKDFVRILETITEDMHLDFAAELSQSIVASTKPLSTNSLSEETTQSYSVNQKHFTQKELGFWLQYNITIDTLKAYRVVSLINFKSQNKEGKEFSFHSSEAEPIFGYLGKHFIKIYRPFSEIRFLYGGSLGENYCFGLERLPSKGDLLFIAGGEKDVLSLAAHGFSAICFNSETVSIPKNIINPNYSLEINFNS